MRILTLLEIHLFHTIQSAINYTSQMQMPPLVSQWGDPLTHGYITSAVKEVRLYGHKKTY